MSNTENVSAAEETRVIDENKIINIDILVIDRMWVLLSSLFFKLLSMFKEPLLQLSLDNSLV